MIDARPRPYGLTIAFGVALCACGGPDGSLTLGELRAAVRGGSSSLSCEWPAVVALDHGCSGTLVHPEVVVYAAHCGTLIDSVSFGESANQLERVVEARRCRAHPEAALGNGFDVAFCLLDEPVEDIPTLPIAAGCELDAVQPGLEATLVGFGIESDGGAFGIKRSAPVVIGQTGHDLVIEPAAAGTCAGDSGGPLVLEVPSGSSGAPQTRLLGVSSAASARGCEPSTEHYSYVPALLPWLESESGRDLTPCFTADASWVPTAGCAGSAAPGIELSWSAGCGSSDAHELLATCGAPFSPELLLESTPPELELVEPGSSMVEIAIASDEAETAIEAIAWDAESGVAEVRFELRDEHGVVQSEERDEVPPYRIEMLPLCSAGFTGFSATTSNSVPVLRIDTCTLTEAFRLSSSLGIGTTGSHVPHQSLVRAHAAFMPNATQPVGRLPLGFIPGQPSIPVSTLLVKLTTRHRRFTLVRLPGPHLPQSCCDFSFDAHNDGS